MNSRTLTFVISLAALVSFMFLAPRESFAHCEIPCGIYDDSVRITLIKEHCTTIEKAMNQINELSKASAPNYNQLVRWVNNKEEHAEKLQEIVSQYFLHQRIKPVASTDKAAYQKYQQHLELLHQMLVNAMKCKQTTDVSHVAGLRASVAAFEKAYFHKH